MGTERRQRLMAWGRRSWAFGPGRCVLLAFVGLGARAVGLSWYRLGLMEIP